MKYRFSSEVTSQLREIKRKNKTLFLRIQKQLNTFSFDPKHPSLRTHKLSGTHKNVWSITITMQIRMLYIIISPTEIFFVDMGTHDKVYRRK